MPAPEPWPVCHRAASAYRPRSIPTVGWEDIGQKQSAGALARTLASSGQTCPTVYWFVSLGFVALHSLRTRSTLVADSIRSESGACVERGLSVVGKAEVRWLFQER